MSLEQDIKGIYQAYLNKAYVQAETAMRHLIAVYPKNSDVLRLGALTALSVNQVVSAQGRMNEAYLYCKETAEMSNTMGNILKAACEWSEAEKFYKKAVSLDKNYIPVRENYIDLLIKSGQPDHALAEINDQKQAYGDSDFLIFSKTNALINLGRYEEALKTIDNISHEFDLDKVSGLKVRICFYLKQYDEMHRIAEMIPATSPEAAEAISSVVNAYAMQKKWAVSEKIIQDACSKPDAIAATFANSLEQLERAGHVEYSKALREQAKQQFKDDADIISEQAYHNLKTGDYSASCELYNKALSLRPGDFSIILNYAQASLVAGEYALCQHLIHAGLQQQPNNQFLFTLVATLNRKAGRDYNDLYNYDEFIRVYDLEPSNDFETMAQFNGALKDCLNRYHAFEAAPLNQSLRGGIQTDLDLFFEDDPILKSFFKMIETPILDYMNHIGYDATHPLKRRNTGDYRINGAWSVMLSPNGHHVNHVHPMGWISSAYYVDVPDVVKSAGNKEGWIKFGEPPIMELDLEAEKSVQPKAGRLVLFPSYMWHGTIPFSGTQSRLTLPFDVVPA